VSEWAELKQIEPVNKTLPELHEKLVSAIADVMKKVCAEVTTKRKKNG
jgi:hypothetical protein